MVNNMNKKYLAPDNSDFFEIIADQCCYVDKTHLIYKMVSKNVETAVRYYFYPVLEDLVKAYFVDTMHCLFEEKKLFLKIYISMTNGTLTKTLIL